MSGISCWQCGREIDGVWSLRGCPYCKVSFDPPVLYSFEEIGTPGHKQCKFQEVSTLEYSEAFIPQDKVWYYQCSVSQGLLVEDGFSKPWISVCQTEKCPMFQTWKLLEKNDYNTGR